MTLLNLQREALVACENRDHRMGKFERETPTQSYATCKRCGAGVTCRTRPMPNQIDIAGEAVAINCR